MAEGSDMRGSLQEETMKGYWWSCTDSKCNHIADDYWQRVLGGKQGKIYVFIRDVMIPSGWDQKHLKQKCPLCQKRTFHITYGFPRSGHPEKKVVVLNMVGLTEINNVPDDHYVPMCWHTKPMPAAYGPWYDFKYLRLIGSISGLTSPAVLERAHLKKLLLMMAKAQNRGSISDLLR
jgi:hypothetical protein